MIGAMKAKYHREREENIAPKYRLKRRTYEVIRAIKKYHPDEIKSILDIGTADGLMLSAIKKEFPETECVGLEYSQELIDTCQDKKIKVVQGDAQNPPFPDNSFDAASATALIEHISDPMKMLRAIRRVLKPGGIFIVTTPVPIFDDIAQLIGHIEKEIHQETFYLKKLKRFFQEAGFEVPETRKFMLSPIGFPKELLIEDIIRFLKLDFILLNQLIVGRKK